MKRILSIFIVLLSLCLPITAIAVVCGPAPTPGGDWVFPGGFCDNILLVCPTSEYTTITQAMAAADAWDTILVAEGTYNEAVTFSQDNLTLRAFGSAENTIITQAAGTTVSFSTKSGCTLDGFTVSMSASTSTNDEVIFSNNDSDVDYNTVKNCIITDVNAGGSTFGLYGIRIDDGHFRLINNTIEIWQKNNQAVYAIWNSAEHTFECRGNNIDVDQDSVGAHMTSALAHAAGASSILYFTENIITLYSTHIDPGMGYGVYAHAKHNYVSGNTIESVTSDTGDACGLFTGAGDTGYYTGNFINVTTGDGDGAWASFTAGTSYATGNNIIGDGVLTAGGTLYLSGNVINGIMHAYVDPTDEHGVGDRGFNDLRYAFTGIGKRTAVGAADYNPSVLTSDYIIAMTNTAAARAVTISTEDEDSGSTSQPRIMIVKDESGGAAAQNITITLESGGNIDGAANKVMNQDYQSVTLYIDGTNAWIY